MGGGIKNRASSRRSPEEQLAAVIADFESRIQARPDDFARSLAYDNMLSACTYATSSIAMYRIEGHCADARDATWARAYDAERTGGRGHPALGRH